MKNGLGKYSDYYKPIDVIPYLIAPDEEFRYITDREFPGVCPYYMISNYGRMYLRYGEVPFRVFNVNQNGYWYTTLLTKYGQRNALIHRLVKMAFDYVDGCEEMVIDHLDGNKLNPFLNNLDWTTTEENTRRYYVLCEKLGNEPDQLVPMYLYNDFIAMNEIKADIRERAYNEKCMHSQDSYKQKNFNDMRNQHNCQTELWNIERNNHSDEEVIRICQMLQDGYTDSYVANTLHIKKSYVSSVRHGKARKDISVNYDFSNYGSKLYHDKWIFTMDQIHAICDYLTKNDLNSMKDKKTFIRKMFSDLNIEYSQAKYVAVLDMYRGREYKSISENYKFL